ncbi:MAG: 4Fe-4S binding protein [Clostridiales bacterium]|nr:4Fe-4S binding protein [Clostridiales bacterium]
MEIAKYLGVEAGAVTPSCAVVLCQGNKTNATTKMIYNGVKSCRMASQLYGGPKDCVYGCVGLGDCVTACPYDAIHICDGVARINPLVCRACKKCVTSCPKGLIELMPLHMAKAAVLCKNHDKGALTRKECKTGCIGCMKCTKVCEYDAVTVENNSAHVDYDKCVGCMKCQEACPVGCIEVIIPGGKTI